MAVMKLNQEKKGYIRWESVLQPNVPHILLMTEGKN